MTSETLHHNTKPSSVSTQLCLIMAAVALPAGVLVYLLASSYSPRIASAQLELSGNVLQGPPKAGAIRFLRESATKPFALSRCEEFVRDLGAGRLAARHAASPKLGAKVAERRVQISVRSLQPFASTRDTDSVSKPFGNPNSLLAWQINVK